MIHQIGWTLPRWRTLVAAPLAARGTSAVTALAAFALFGAMYVIHTFAQVPQACLPQCAHYALRPVAAANAAAVADGVALVQCDW